MPANRFIRPSLSQRPERPAKPPLTNRRPDVIVYRAETIGLTPTRPEHVLLVVEVVSPGSETTERIRIVKVDRCAKAGIPFSRRVEQAATGVPIVHTHVLDPATEAYRDGEMFTGAVAVKATAPSSVVVDPGVARGATRPALTEGSSPRAPDASAERGETRISPRSRRARVFGPGAPEGSAAVRRPAAASGWRSTGSSAARLRENHPEPPLI
ncbi:hypothetical protein EBF04_19035 [Streptomyces sp. I6]|nr:hypothetical protein EBF04_19035 [Streptomyces sp. I6]